MPPGTNRRYNEQHTDPQRDALQPPALVLDLVQRDWQLLLILIRVYVAE